MKKIIAFLSAVVVSLIYKGVAFAALCPSSFSSLCNINLASGGGVIGAIVQVLLIFAIVVCLFFLIYGGIRYISSGGDKGKISQARGMIVAAIVGLLISLLSFFILNFILVAVTGQGVSSLSVPTLLQ
jgi:hypothetical protein